MQVKIKELFKCMNCDKNSPLKWKEDIVISKDKVYLNVHCWNIEDNENKACALNAGSAK